jgi:hypothetical protein
MTPLLKNSFAPVRDELLSKAQSLLVDFGVKRISAEEAAEYAGRQLPAGAVYVLLRGIALNEGTGGFDVTVQGDSVSVHHGSLGRRPVPMLRRAIVAVLPEFPKTVYVSCSMAE